MFARRLALEEVGSEVRKSTLGDDNPGTAVGSRALTRTRQTPERAMVSTRACVAHCHRLPCACLEAREPGRGLVNPLALLRRCLSTPRNCPPFLPAQAPGNCPSSASTFTKRHGVSPGPCGGMAMCLILFEWHGRALHIFIIYI